MAWLMPSRGGDRRRKRVEEGGNCKELLMQQEEEEEEEEGLGMMTISLSCHFGVVAVCGGVDRCIGKRGG